MKLLTLLFVSLPLLVFAAGDDGQPHTKTNPSNQTAATNPSPCRSKSLPAVALNDSTNSLRNLNNPGSSPNDSTVQLRLPANKKKLLQKKQPEDFIPNIPPTYVAAYFPCR